MARCHEEIITNDHVNRNIAVKPGNVAASLFGVEYEDADTEFISTTSVASGKEFYDVVHEPEPSVINHFLPPGGYVIRYMEGSYLLLDEIPTKFVIGGPRGLKVRWSRQKKWTEANFSIKEKMSEPSGFIASPDVSDLFYLEFTRPHKMQLVPPPNAAGSIRVRVIRFIPNFVRDNNVS